MATRWVNVDRETPMLLPPDLRDWVGKDDLVRFIVDAVETCDLSAAQVNVKGSGNAQYPPAMMLSLLIYCYANGIFSSRQIERATYGQVSVRYLCGNEHPDHDTIAKFRRENGALLQSCFVGVLQLAKELKAFEKLGTVSVDGTKLGARASKNANRRMGSLEEEIAGLQGEIKALLAQAEQADAQETGQGERLAEELQDKRARQAALREAKEQLQERQRQAREQRLKQSRGELLEPADPPKAPAEEDGGGEGGAEAPLEEQAPTEAPTPQPEPPVAKRDAKLAINLVDPESRLMKDAHGVYLQGYNAQLAVEAGAQSRSQLILGVALTNEANDRRALAHAFAHIPPQLRGDITHLLADTGFDNADLIEATEKQHRVTVLCPPQTKQPSPPSPHGCASAVQVRRQEKARAMRARLDQPENKQLYARRAASVEPVFGVLKNVLGFRRFRLFGLAKSKIELVLVAIAYNLRRLAQMALA